MTVPVNSHQPTIDEASAKALPVIHTNRKILFPHCTIELEWHARFEKMNQGDLLLIMPVYRPFRDYILHSNTFCTLARITRIEHRPDQRMIEVRGLQRARITRRQRPGTALWASVPEPFSESDGLAERLRRRAQEFVFLINIQESDRLIYLMTFISALAELTDFVAHYFILDPKRRRVLFLETDPEKRAATLNSWLDDMIQDIQKKTAGTQH